jgi:uncharacterized membrane protein YcaP (DUF421 family)
MPKGGGEMREATEMIIVTFRSVLAFFSLLLLMRFIRKKQLSQYTFYDYIVGITIGSIAATLSIELENRTITVYMGMLIWGILPIAMGWLYLNNMTVRKIFDSEPVVLIKQGKIMEENLKSELLNLEDLMMQLRSVGVFDLSDVEYAVLEKNGQVNALKKSEKQPLTPKDLGIKTVSYGAPLVLVLDGRMMHDTLRGAPYSESWLLGELQKKGVEDLSQVMLAQVDTMGKLYVDLRDDKLEVPQDTANQQILANLEKAMADLETFSLETEHEGAKEMYALQAEKIRNVYEEIKPLLR